MGKRREQARAYWRGVIAECVASELPAKVFCEQRGLSADAFYTWRSRLREALPESGTFVPVGDSVRMEVELPNGVKLRVPASCAVETLQRVVEALSC